MMKIWTLYDDQTSDNPGVFVLREFAVSSGALASGMALTSKSIEALHDHGTNVLGLHWVPRNEDDDPRILGSYI